MYKISFPYGRQRVLETLCLMSLFWLPHIALDYAFKGADGTFVQMYHGQYVMFFSSLIASFFLYRPGCFENFINIFFHRTILAGAFLFLLGAILSTNSLWNWRLLAIVCVLAGFMILGAKFVISSSVKMQKLVAFLIIIPCFVTVFGSVLLEFFGPLDFGYSLSNVKQDEYARPRWSFMHKAANGFGFDAALASFFLTLSIFDSKNKIVKFLLVLPLAISLFALLMSGTRAAFLFYLVASTSFFIHRSGVKAIIILFSGLIVTALLVVISQQLGTVVSFLRIEGDLQQISSLRWRGIVGMWDHFIASPFNGLGFGSADKNFPVHPSNIFYVGLLAEVGIFGFLGALLVMVYPICLLYAKSTKFSLPKQTPFLVVFSASGLQGFLIYLMFEFDVLRVSVNNQLFFFCWGVVVFYFIDARTNSNLKNAFTLSR